MDAWKKRLGFHAPGGAYLVLLDARGRILWRHGGKFEPEAWNTLALGGRC